MSKINKEYFLLGEESSENIKEYINHQIEKDKIYKISELREKVINRYKKKSKEEITDEYNFFTHRKNALESTDYSVQYSIGIAILSSFFTLSLGYITSFFNLVNYYYLFLLLIGIFLAILFLALGYMQRLYTKRIIYYNFMIDILKDLIE